MRKTFIHAIEYILKTTNSFIIFHVMVMSSFISLYFPTVGYLNYSLPFANSLKISKSPKITVQAVSYV